MKLPDVSGVYDYAGPNRDSRFRPPPVLPSANAKASASWLHPFEAQYPARLYPCLRFAVHLAMQNSWPSGSLLLSRGTLSFPASCRFIPAHCIGDLATTEPPKNAVRNHGVDNYIDRLHGTDSLRWGMFAKTPSSRRSKRRRRNPQLARSRPRTRAGDIYPALLIGTRASTIRRQRLYCRSVARAPRSIRQLRRCHGHTD